ncbi:hypothetical protein ACHAWF_018139, partial [Thalassiosira exigua]
EIDCLASPWVNELSNKSCVNIPWLGRSICMEAKGEQPYNSIGATDSEALFYVILNALRARFDTLPTSPDTAILNFLLGCGPHIQFAYSWSGAREGSAVWNGLHYLVQEPPFDSAHLCDCDYSTDFRAVKKDDDRVVVIATAPLTDDEVWVGIRWGSSYCSTFRTTATRRSFESTGWSAT